MPSIAFHTLAGHFSMFGELFGGEEIYLPPFPEDRRLLKEADDYEDGLECVCAQSAWRQCKY